MCHMERKCVLKSIAMNDRPTPETDADFCDSVEATNSPSVKLIECLERERDEALDQERIHYDNYQSLRAYAERLAEILRWPTNEEIERWLAETRAECGEEMP
jgi:hypothetical protein